MGRGRRCAEPTPRSPVAPPAHRPARAAPPPTGPHAPCTADHRSHLDARARDTPGRTWRGRGDSWAQDLAARLAGTDGPVWIAFHHEPEGDGDIAAWTRMQERLAPLVRSAASNVAYTVVLTGWNQFYGEDEYALENLCPRGVTVDVAGFDIFQHYGPGHPDWTDLDNDYFDRIQPWARSREVAWAIAETGVTDRAAEVRPDVIEESATLARQHDAVTPWPVRRGCRTRDRGSSDAGQVTGPSGWMLRVSSRRRRRGS